MEEGENMWKVDKREEALQLVSSEDIVLIICKFESIAVILGTFRFFSMLNTGIITVLSMATMILMKHAIAIKLVVMA